MKVDNRPTNNIPQKKVLKVIAIGASAGGLEALQDFLSHLPPIENVCLIIAQHLSPSHKSMLVSLLTKETKLEVAEAIHGDKLESNKIYITPPDSEITIYKGKIILNKPSSAIGPKPSIDILLKSLSKDFKENVIAVILSGTGSDGAAGIFVVKENKGYVIAQEPHTAKYDGMPISAINTGVVDAILSPDKIGEEILDYIINPNHEIQQSLEAEGTLNKIFQILSDRTGTDFTNYKPATIGRRLNKRLANFHIDNLEDYLQILRNDPKEVDEMFNTILIGVTSFFRDRSAFLALEEQIKKIIASKTKTDTIRIWTPGCSTGEEPYSIAITFDKILREKGLSIPVQIFATDIDDRSIDFARKGIYSEEKISKLPKETLDTYFTPNVEGFTINKNIRGMILFSKHNLIKNPPFFKLDLISCRNLLIYFDNYLQNHLIPLFHYSLLPKGFLFLGKSETVGQFEKLFQTLDGKNKIYQRKPGESLRKSKLQSHPILKTNSQQLESKSNESLVTINDLIKETIFKTYEHPYVIVNDEFEVQEIHGDIRLFLSLTSGKANLNLFKLLNSELQIEVRSILINTIKERKVTKSSIRRFTLFEKTYFVRIIAKPLIFNHKIKDLFLVIFEQLDLEDYVSKGIVTNDSKNENQRVAELENELLATKEQVQTYIEEIETSNEELQSLNEEMQSTNEELQSTNEELETSNEELQSTYEEVQIAYSELKSTHETLELKERELLEKEYNLKALLNNSLQAFLLIDDAYAVIEWNQIANDLWNKLRKANIKKGETILDLISEENLENFIKQIREAFKGKTIKKQLKESSVDKIEYWFEYSITPVQDHTGQVKIISIGLIDITEKIEVSAKLNKSEKLLTSVFNANGTGICITDSSGKFIEVNDEYCKIYGYSKEELLGQHFTKVVPSENREELEKLHDDFIFGKEEMSKEWIAKRKNGALIDIFASPRLLIYEDGSRYKVTSVRDITENKKYKNILQKSSDSALVGGWEYDNITGVFALSEEAKNIFEIPKLTENLYSFSSNMFKDEAKVILDKAMKDALEKGEAFDLEIQGHNTNDDSIWVRITCKPIVYNNKTLKLFGTLQNITQQYFLLKEQKRTSDLLKRTEAISKVGSSEFNLLTKESVWSDEFYRICGLDKDTHRASFDLRISLIHPDDKEYALKIYQDAIEKGGDYELEKRIITPEGIIKHIKSEGTVELNESGIPSRMIGVFKDITEQVRNEKIAKEKEQIFKNLFDNVSHLAVQGLDENGQVVYWNKSSEKLYGYSEKEAVGEIISDLTALDNQKSNLMIELKSMIQTGQNLKSREEIHKKKDGSIVPVFVNYTLIEIPNRPTQIFRFNIDISEAKSATDALIQSNLRYEIATKATSDTIWDWNLETNTVIRAENFKTIFGHEIDKFSSNNKYWLQLIHPDDRRGISRSLNKFLDSDQELWESEFRLIKSNGEYAIVLDKGILLRDSNNKPIRMIGATQDITARKNDEQELLNLSTQLIRRAKDLETSNADLEQFAYVASHDLQEPLRMITGFLSQLQKKYEDILDEKGKKYIYFATDGATRMRQIILDLLDFSRVGRIKENEQNIDINEILENILILNSRLIEEKEAQVSFESMPIVYAQKTPLQQIFQNIINNALKYQKPNQKPIIKIKAEDQGTNWLFSISDNGIGIEKEYLVKVFTIFQRLHTKAEYEGTGLGLAICQKIVQNLGGKIWVESDIGKGSVFYFTIPK
ncbi:PAS domain S-box [Belliella baltica DSM 15883]|uniref:PAS domain S-box n=1 Tax=Belliella baltica (strain DSM 15883 / CIP 108006 / LMG 21964 / BA134) TaxID=866536 RepID=I3Z7C8_BELBD|nr:PAS domain S-box protein [Belliella baltica]AFL85146.1 PAS domain S-box [Belliella baltica DSM 15883]